MKLKFIISVLFILTAYYTQAQITINFTGHYLTEPVNLTKVTVENLTNNNQLILESSFAVDLVSELNISELKTENNLLTYPNPFDGSVLIKLPPTIKENFNVLISDITGKEIINKSYTTFENTIKFTPAKKGLYFIIIASNNKSFTAKLICTKANSDRFKIEQIIESNTTENFNKTKSNPQLLYTVGDILKYTGYYDKHIRVLSASPTQSQTSDLDFQSCIDFENNTYAVTKIGNQWWMAENLKSTKYFEGSNISGSYSYDNSSTNENIYGRLYTWSAIMNGSSGNNNNPSGIQGACPAGWHVPSEIEWDEMRDVLGGQTIMGGKVKATTYEYWLSPNTEATNTSGMSILPGGIRFDDPLFQYINEGAYFWNSSDFEDLDSASGYSFTYNSGEASYIWNLKTTGQSVRCVMN